MSRLFFYSKSVELDGQSSKFDQLIQGDVFITGAHRAKDSPVMPDMIKVRMRDASRMVGVFDM